MILFNCLEMNNPLNFKKEFNIHVTLTGIDVTFTGFNVTHTGKKMTNTGFLCDAYRINVTFTGKKDSV